MKDKQELRHNVAKYINEYKTANKKQNEEWLRKLDNLRNDIDTDPIKEREYYNIRNDMILSNGGFAMKYVMKYSSLLGDDASVSELFQEAMIGLIETIEKFDIKKTTAFTTYAYYHVTKRIIDYIKKCKLIKAPKEISRNMRHIDELRCKFFSHNEREPSELEIKNLLLDEKGLDVRKDIVKDVMTLLILNGQENEETFIVEYADQDVEDHKEDFFTILERHLLIELSKYDSETQDIIMKRFGITYDFPMTIEEIEFIKERSVQDVKLYG